MPKVSETILQADMIRGPIPEESKLNTVCEKIIQGWSSKDMKDEVLKVVYRQQSQANGSIHVGDIGELVATILILFTMDRVLNPENLRLIDLPTFLKTLLPSSSWESIRLRKSPAKILLHGLKEAISSAFLNCLRALSKRVWLMA